VRPKLKLHQNYEDSCKAVEDLENEYKQKVGKENESRNTCLYVVFSIDFSLRRSMFQGNHSFTGLSGHNFMDSMPILNRKIIYEEMKHVREGDPHIPVI
jgi:hypothetical protein